MPVGRIADILKQLDNIPLALTSAEQYQKLNGLVKLVIVFDESLSDSKALSGVLPVPAAEDGIRYDQPAYVIFTSGSTGRYPMSYF